ncbi:MAG: phage tail sheath subtilisin-like domain-containing protein [Deltaproteobacteria bacterium]|nr:phage tail sheath subtilisin-like domain-containing protein [Deltaproteobacteria bacterium]
MSVSFNQIPVSLMTPGVFAEFDTSKMVSGTPSMPGELLLIGQRLAVGQVAAGVPTRVLSDSQGMADFGRGSLLAAMIAAVKKANPNVDLWAVALDDLAAGVAAAGAVTVTGPAVGGGTIALYIGGRRMPVGVAANDTANTIAANMAASINADPDCAATAAVDGVTLSKVNITCRWKGETGNSLDIRHSYFQGERLPAGVTLAVTAMTGGAGNPDITAALTATAGGWYNTITTPYTDGANMLVLETELDGRWGPMRQSEGVAFTALGGTHAAGSTWASTRNNPLIVAVGLQKSPTPPWIAAAIAAAVDAGEPDPGRPRQTLPLTGMLAPADADRFTQTERNLHLKDGLATYTVDAGGNCLVERLVTNHTQNTAGLPDAGLVDVETIRVLAYLRFSTRVRLTQKYPRHKLANDGTRFGGGQAVATPSILRGEMIALFAEWMEAGLVENISQFKRDLVIERDANDANRVNAIIPPDVINQLRILALQFQPRL